MTRREVAGSLAQAFVVRLAGSTASMGPSAWLKRVRAGDADGLACHYHFHAPIALPARGRITGSDLPSPTAVTVEAGTPWAIR